MTHSHLSTNYCSEPIFPATMQAAHAQPMCLGFEREKGPGLLILTASRNDGSWWLFGDLARILMFWRTDSTFDQLIGFAAT